MSFIKLVRPPDGPWLLVDDDDEPKEKMRWLGFNKDLLSPADWQRALERHVVRCSKFSKWVDSRDSQPLTALLALIDAKLASQADELVKV